jgi:hypothetical protein
MLSINPQEPTKGFEDILQRLTKPLQQKLGFQVPPDRQLRRRSNRAWQPALQQALDASATLQADSMDVRDQAADDLEAGLVTSWSEKLPSELAGSSWFEQVAQACRMLDPVAPDDRAGELRPRVQQAAARLSGAQTRSTLPGFIPLLLAMLVTAGLTGLYWYINSPLTDPVGQLATLAGAVAAVCAALLLVEWAVNAWQRRAEISAASASLSTAWTVYRDNVVATVAHNQAIAALETLAGLASDLAGRQKDKLAHLKRLAPKPGEVRQVQSEALARHPLWHGSILGAGPAFTSLVAGPQVKLLIEEWLITDPAQLNRLFADHLRGSEARARQWLWSDPRGAVQMNEDWLKQLDLAALSRRSAWEAYELDPAEGKRRIQTIAQFHAAPATAGVESLPDGLDTKAFVIAPYAFGTFIEGVLPNPNISESANEDAVRLLVCGPRQLRSEDLLTGSAAFRESLKRRGQSMYFPSPVIEQMVQDRGIEGRVSKRLPGGSGNLVLGSETGDGDRREESKDLQDRSANRALPY